MSTPEPARGISPETLLANVRNTMPYLFEPARGGLPELPYVNELLAHRSEMASEPGRALTHAEYYRLCVSAHFATVATPVPTDVDNQIRRGLWSPELDTPAVDAMVATVLEAATWDTRPVSKRWVASPRSGHVLSGHGGEWLSIAGGAYSALRRRSPGAATELAQRIVGEMKREQEIYSELKSAGDTLGMLKAATLIAHNLGDLDRVMDLWELPESDPLWGSAYQAGHSEAPPARSGSPGPGQKVRAILAEAGDLNKALMAAENHRHFALRAPRCLRRAPELLVPIGPFFDDWGAEVVKRLVEPTELAEVATALVEGDARLRTAAARGGTAPAGYARALAGIEATLPGGAAALEPLLAARASRELRAGALREAIAIPRAEFEQSLSARARALVARVRR